MSAIATLPLPKKPTLRQAASKYWQLRQYSRQGVIDPLALVTSMATLAKDAPRLAPLCCRTILQQDHTTQET